MLWFACWSSSRPPRKAPPPKLFSVLAVASCSSSSAISASHPLKKERSASPPTPSKASQIAELWRTCSNCWIRNLFWRAHRSFVVNIHRIQEVVPWFKSSYQLRMDDRRHTEIPVSRGQTKRLRELFNL